MVIDVAEKRIDDGQAFKVMTDVQLVGHAHPAVHLDRVLADETGALSDLRFRAGALT